MAMKRSTIMIVGCGPGSLEYLTPAARKTIERAEVLVGAKRLLDLFPDSEAERIIFESDVGRVLEAINENRQHKQIAVLVTGDPGLCSLARPVLDRFGPHACEVVPGISSLQVAFARFGLDWADARIIDAHKEKPEVDARSLVHERKIAILAGGKEAWPWITNLVQTLGSGYRIYTCENLTFEDEKIRQVASVDLVHLETSSRTIVLLIKEGFPP